jgi:hypothetical protein
VRFFIDKGDPESIKGNYQIGVEKNMSKKNALPLMIIKQLQFNFGNI